jgi:hypothetical protein
MPLGDDARRGNGETDWTIPPPRDAGNGGDRFAGLGGFGGQRPSGPSLPDLSTVLALLEAIRAAVPGEVQVGLNALLREVLLTLRALIDWQIERLDRPRAETQLEDIPLD